jgi:hypothetical protein
MSEKRISFNENDKLILYQEVDGICPLCPKPLMYFKNGKSEKRYEVAHIYPLNPTKNEIELLKDEEKLSNDPNDITNLICLCVECHTIYDKPKTVEEYRKLVVKKRALLTKKSAKDLWNETKVEIEILALIEHLSSDDLEIDGQDILKYDPKTIDDKTSQSLPYLSRRKIHRDVQDFYYFIKEKFIEIDKSQPLTSEIISNQVRTHYLLLTKKFGAAQQKEVLDGMVSWLAKRTNQDSYEASEIVISYFIQNCEVF